MQAAYLLRITSQLLSSMMGGMAVFCLYYAAQIPEHNVVWYLFLSAMKWGGCATVIVYFQCKYLDQ
jgi:hypothetical protein